MSVCLCLAVRRRTGRDGVRAADALRELVAEPAARTYLAAVSAAAAAAGSAYLGAASPVAAVGGDVLALFAAPWFLVLGAVWASIGVLWSAGSDTAAAWLDLRVLWAVSAVLCVLEGTLVVGRLTRYAATITPGARRWAAPLTAAWIVAGAALALLVF